MEMSSLDHGSIPNEEEMVDNLSDNQDATFDFEDYEAVEEVGMMLSRSIVPPIAEEEVF